MLARHLDDPEPRPPERAGLRRRLRVLRNVAEELRGPRVVREVERYLRVEEHDVRGTGAERLGLRDGLRGLGHLAEVALHAREHHERVHVLRGVLEALREEPLRLLAAARPVCGAARLVLLHAVLGSAACDGKRKRRGAKRG